MHLIFFAMQFWHELWARRRLHVRLIRRQWSHDLLKSIPARKNKKDESVRTKKRKKLPRNYPQKMMRTSDLPPSRQFNLTSPPELPRQLRSTTKYSAGDSLRSNFSTSNSGRGRCAMSAANSRDDVLQQPADTKCSPVILGGRTSPPAIADGGDARWRRPTTE